jgi:cystathionine beta-lyase
MSKPSTTLIHHPYTPPANFAAPQPGIYKASTVFFADVAAMRARDWKHKTGYTYGLHGTPTTFTLEERIATLEGGKHCTLVPSGLAAVVLVGMALLKAGDEVLIPDNAYGPNKSFARRAGRLRHHPPLYDAMNPADLAAKLSARKPGWCGWKRRAPSRWSSPTCRRWSTSAAPAAW